MKIINNHIPRTIFGVKFNLYGYRNGKKYLELNCCIRTDTKKEQLEHIRNLKLYPETFTDVKEIKWLIKPNED